MSQRSNLGLNRIYKHNADIEKAIAKDYAFLYGTTKKKLQELYATLGNNPTLADARKYNRLSNLIKEVRTQYEKLTGKTITKAEMLSAHNYTAQYFNSMYEGESVNGPFKWKNPQIEAVRASVFYEGTGMDLPKRFGKNFTQNFSEIEASITRGLANGTGYKKTAELIKDNFAKGYNDAIRVVRTESTRNRTEGFNSAFDVMQKEGLPVKKVWISTLDARTRTFAKGKYDHVVLDQLESDDTGMFDVGQGIGKIDGPGLSGEPGFDINCFLPNTEVEGAFVAGSKSFYSGDIIKINTASGKTLSVTPNHKIATDKGWIRACDLTEGTYAVSNSINVNDCIEGSEINNKQNPTMIQDAFDSIGIHGAITLSNIISTLDFDGDSKFMDGKVDIVDMNIELGIDIYSVITSENVSDLNFIISNSTNSLMKTDGSFNLFGNTYTSTFRGFPCTSALPFNKIGILFDFGPFKALCIGSSSYANTGLGENSKKCASTYTRFITKLFEANSGNIRFDKIVNIVRDNFSGHVYDLQSIDGYIMSNGIVSSNCRCAVGAFFDDDGPRMTRDELNAEWEAWAQKNGYDDTISRIERLTV